MDKHLDFLKYIDKSKFPHILSVGTDCSGIEAPIHALQLLNIQVNHKFSCDNDPEVIKSIQENYNPEVIYTDIMTRDHTKLPHVDLYIAGFPCQSFSLLGKRHGFNDPKNGTVFFHCWETIKYVKPKIFILENVKGLINHDNKQTFKTILDYLNKFKQYNIYYDIYNTSDYGLPQNRERIFIIGLHKKLFKKFKKPLPIKLEIMVSDIIDRLISKNTIFGKITEHKLDVLYDLMKRGKIDNLNNPWCVNLNVSSSKRTTPMLNKCPCLLAGNGGDCIYYFTPIRRRLTPREYLRLQGFSDTFRQSENLTNGKMYKQVGNSMSTSVLCFIYEAIFSCAIK
tara:strand:- start:1013 stop:2029 length:1017 start_codon:yes stop_codon:yes gene_type:complete